MKKLVELVNKAHLTINPNAKYMGQVNIMYIVFYILYLWYIPMFFSFDLGSLDEITNSSIQKKIALIFIFRIFPMLALFFESIMKLFTGYYENGELVMN